MQNRFWPACCENEVSSRQPGWSVHMGNYHLGCRDLSVGHYFFLPFIHIQLKIQQVNNISIFIDSSPFLGFVVFSILRR